MSTENTANSFKALDGAALAGILGKANAAKKEREDAKSSSKGGGKFAPIGYPQEGTSKIRIFLDPASQLYRSVKTFTLTEPKFKRIIDPRFYVNATAPDGTVVPDEVIQKVWKMTKDIGWQNNAKYIALCYIQVLSADKVHEKFWQPGECYLMAANGKFEDALLAQLGALMEGCSEDMAASLNPLTDGWAWTMNVVKGSQGSVSLTPTVGVKSPALEELPEWYKPLADQYCSDGYSEEDIGHLFDQLQAIRDEKGLDEAETYDLTEEQLKAAEAAKQTPMEFAAALGNEKAVADLAAAEAAAKEAADKAPKLPDATKAKAEEEAKGKAEESKEPDANWGLTEAQLTAAKAMNKSPLEFAAEILNNEEAKVALAAQADGESKEEEKSDDETFGLSADQMAAADGAGIPYKDFAEMCK